MWRALRCVDVVGSADRTMVLSSFLPPIPLLPGITQLAPPDTTVIWLDYTRFLLASVYPLQLAFVALYLYGRVDQYKGQGDGAVEPRGAESGAVKEIEGDALRLASPQLSLLPLTVIMLFFFFFLYLGFGV